MTAKARNTDPDTAHEAAASISDDRLAHVHAAIVAELRKAHPGGLILDELSERTGIEKCTVSPRRIALEAGGLVHCTGEKRKGNANKSQQIWFFGPAPEDDDMDFG